MQFPPPTPQQARILWFAFTTLAVVIVLGVLGLIAWSCGWILQQLSSVLLPLAVAGIIAYLLDPLVNIIEKHNIPRIRAILLVFFSAVMLILAMLAWLVPYLVVEISDLINRLPDYATLLSKKVSDLLSNSALGMRAKQTWDSELGLSFQGWLAKTIPIISQWLWSQFAHVASWFGLLAGLALVPVYTFYFLLEKSGITKHWTDYLPIRESSVKEEIIFILGAINDCLIVFFRGQVLVALCDGLLLTIGFMLMGLNFAILLGLSAGLLSIVPYLGVMISIVPALLLAVAQFQDWWHPILVLGLFGIVQLLEGFVISPKIIGDRVGLHPLTIIVAVMIGTTLLGGVLGGVLAIPLTAALRVLMFRYIWRKKRTV